MNTSLTNIYYAQPFNYEGVGWVGGVIEVGIEVVRTGTNKKNSYTTMYGLLELFSEREIANLSLQCCKT